MTVDEEKRLDHLLVVCVDCGKLTDQQEARLRLFRTGYCVFCGGTLTLDSRALACAAIGADDDNG